MKKIIILILYYIVSTHTFIYADELADAQAKAHDDLNGENMSIGVSAGLFSLTSGYMLRLSLPIKNVYRIRMRGGCHYYSGELLNPQEKIFSGVVGVGVEMGSPPSNKPFRIYGGPDVAFYFPKYIKDEGKFDAYLSFGGYGGIEFFVNPNVGSFIEFGGQGIYNRYKGNDFAEGVFFQGGINIYR